MLVLYSYCIRFGVSLHSCCIRSVVVLELGCVGRVFGFAAVLYHCCNGCLLTLYSDVLALYSEYSCLVRVSVLHACCICIRSKLVVADSCCIRAAFA